MEQTTIPTDGFQSLAQLVEKQAKKLSYSKKVVLKTSKTKRVFHIIRGDNANKGEKQKII